MRNSKLKNQMLKSIGGKTIEPTISYDCVIPCYRFGNILRHTLAHNLKYLKNFIVVTSENDLETINTCSKFNIKIVFINTTDKHGRFSESKCRNAGFDSSKADWIISMDADILVHQDISKFLPELNYDTMYGAKRKFIKTNKKNKEDVQKPLGFLQIFNRHKAIELGARFSVRRSYGHGGPDTHFRKHWDGKVQMLPKVFVSHYGDKGMKGNFKSCLESWSPNSR